MGNHDGTVVDAVVVVRHLDLASAGEGQVDRHGEARIDLTHEERPAVPHRQLPRRGRVPFRNQRSGIQVEIAVRDDAFSGDFLFQAVIDVRAAGSGLRTYGKYGVVGNRHVGGEVEPLSNLKRGRAAQFHEARAEPYVPVRARQVRAAGEREYRGGSGAGDYTLVVRVKQTARDLHASYAVREDEVVETARAALLAEDRVTPRQPEVDVSLHFEVPVFQRV